MYVVSNVHADVVLEDGLASGRTRSLLTVPMKQRLVEQHRISVTAPGYEPYTGVVQLRAGDVTQLDLSLLRARAEEPPASTKASAPP